MKRILLLLCIIVAIQVVAQETQFRHILITNDDGVEDKERLLALARAVNLVAEHVSIVVPDSDRSGTSNHTTFGKHQSNLEIICTHARDKNGIAFYTMPGNPADCALLGLTGFFGADRPDLVLSGINGGPNIGPDWFGSGTIGAVRMAAFLGVKAVAISGFEDEYPESFVMIPDWIMQFISSGALDVLEKNTYLTIGIPEIPPKEIKGVQIARRQIAFSEDADIAFHQIEGNDPHITGNQSTWTLNAKGIGGTTITNSDEEWLRDGYIVLTPMSLDENCPELLNRLISCSDSIPGFNQ